MASRCVYLLFLFTGLISVLSASNTTSLSISITAATTRNVSTTRTTDTTRNFSTNRTTATTSYYMASNVSDGYIVNKTCPDAKVYPSLSYAVDTTGSMSYTMQQLTENNQFLIERISNRSSADIRQYSLMEFNDPTVGPLRITCSATEFVYYVKSLYPYDGGDCPELAMAGLLQLLENSPYGSLAVVITDASAKDYSDTYAVNRIYSLIDAKQIKVIFLATGICYSDQTADFVIYKDIATQSYGHVFKNVYFSSNSALLNLLDYFLSIPINSTTKIFSQNLEWGSYSGNFSVSKNFSALIVSTSGLINSLNLTEPSGNIANTITFMSETWGSLFLVQNPKKGIWRIDGYAGRSSSVRIEGFSATNISSAINCSKCDINASCKKYPNFQTCDCNEGFKGNGYTCSDIDECNSYLNNCSYYSYASTCVNTYGSYYCQCSYGFESVGNTSCVDVNECSRPDLNRCHPLANCTNYFGSYSCSCPTNYYGDGYYCEFNECTTGVCGFGKECIKNNGSYSCVDPCTNYTILNDPWRSVSYSLYPYYGYCDSYLYGWYRFMGSGGTRMPEYCPSIGSCYTNYPLWLSTSHPKQVEGIANRTACARTSWSCCSYTTDVKVKSCRGGYYVYKFQGTPLCNAAYCTDPATANTSCACAEDEECRMVDGNFGCYCKNTDDVFALENLRPNLSCGNQEIKVSFRKCLLKQLNLKPESIHLIDGNCTGIPEYNSTNIISVVSPLKTGACGNTLIKNASSLIYRNTIYLSLDTNSSIGGEDVVSITYSCVYPLDIGITLETALNPFVSSVVINMEGTGTFTARIVLYKDASYLSPYEGSAVVLTNKTILYIGTFLDGGDTSQFVLQLKNCYATPTQNGSDSTRYDIIKDSCPSKQDSTIRVFENGVSRMGRFGVQLFGYIQDHNTVYLHCNIHVCDIKSEICNSTCTGFTARSATPTQTVSIGPISRQAETAVPLPETNAMPSTGNNGNNGVSTLMPSWTSAILLLYLMFMIFN
ncbi:uromodulin-like [Bombina bombina]|uniref:uromodulin-like n=1 Tax=Bombina bombina TaxID=8345 RepID=UPI00235B064F|nr:uromodulin-like [Bombina bombina]